MKFIVMLHIYVLLSVYGVLDGFSSYFALSSATISFKHSISSDLTKSNSKQKNIKCLKL